MPSVDVVVVLRVLLVALLVFVPMISEARRAARHERLWQLRGGVEPADDVYAVMRLVYPGAFLAMIAEGLADPRGWSLSMFLVGLVVFVVGKWLKWWAIETLGPFWTFRVVVMPGTTSVSHGPYRYIRHPNYIGVVGELVGVACMMHANATGPVGVLLFSALMLRRIGVEERARDAILRRS